VDGELVIEGEEEEEGGGLREEEEEREGREDVDLRIIIFFPWFVFDLCHLLYIIVSLLLLSFTTINGKMIKVLRERLEPRPMIDVP
jgi:hypothetical protein